jgi:hypothetical protein
MTVPSLFVRAAVVVGVCAIIVVCAPDEQAARPSGEGREAARLSQALTPESTPTMRDGVAAAILIDVSGSMEKRAGNGDRTPKIEIARRAALDLVDQFARYAADNPTEPVVLGIYEFSSQSGKPDCREVIKMGAPNRASAAAAVAAMEAEGGTPIGDAMIVGKKALDATGLARRHLLVVTDGENTDGSKPEAVAAAIAKRPETERPSLYFVAFDIDANRFNAVKDAGGLVLGADTGKALAETLDSLLRGKILIEK